MEKKEKNEENKNDEALEELLKAIHMDNNASFHNRMIHLGIKARKQGLNVHESLAKPKK